MRTTLTLDDDLLQQAMRFTGLQEKSLLMRAALQALVARESARRLAQLGGSQPALKAAPRKRDRARGTSVSNRSGKTP